MIAKPRFIHWVLLFQEFYFEVKYQKRTKNQTTNNLSFLKEDSMLKLKDDLEIDDFLCKYVLSTLQYFIPWFVDFANYLVSDMVPKYIILPTLEVYSLYEEVLLVWAILALDMCRWIDSEICSWDWDDEYYEGMSLITSGVHHSGVYIVHKIFQYGYYWHTIHNEKHDNLWDCNQFKK